MDHSSGNAKLKWALAEDALQMRNEITHTILKADLSNLMGIYLTSVATSLFS
jgi:hypothetical protein